MSSPKKLSVSQRGFAPILIVLLIAFAIGGYLVYQNQIKPAYTPQQSTQTNSTPSSNPANDVTNWKTHSDERGFSFQYPPHWNNAFDYCSTPPNIGSNELSANCIKTVIFTSNLPDENEDLDRDLVITSTTNIKIAGYDAKRKIFSLSDNDVPDTYEAWIYKDNKPFILWLSYIGVNTSKKQADDFVNILDQILSTFKFLGI